jgi:putative transposase
MASRSSSAHLGRPHRGQAVRHQLRPPWPRLGPSRAVDHNYKTPLIEKAIRMAARNYPLGENAVFHSDRGRNYTSAQFARVLRSHGLRHSCGRTGICYDNAMAESFFALKNEHVHRTQYPTRDHAPRDVVRYIEFWYNSRRRHSGLQYRIPFQVHNEYLEKQLAA